MESYDVVLVLFCFIKRNSISNDTRLRPVSLVLVLVVVRKMERIFDDLYTLCCCVCLVVLVVLF